MWALGFCVVLLYVNSRSVSNFGTVESWFALIKVTAIVLFIILGAARIFGGGHPPAACAISPAFPADSCPRDLPGVWMAVIVGIFSFNGIEVIAVTSGEARDPQARHPCRAAQHAAAAVRVLRAGHAIIVTLRAVDGHRRQGRRRRVRS